MGPPPAGPPQPIGPANARLQGVVVLLVVAPQQTLHVQPLLIFEPHHHGNGSFPGSSLRNPEHPFAFPRGLEPLPLLRPTRRRRQFTHVFVSLCHVSASLEPLDRLGCFSI